MTGRYDPAIIAIAVFVAAITTYSTIGLARRIASDELAHWKRVAWLFGISCVTGTSIWALQFISMIAFRWDVPIGYAFQPTLVSWLLAIAATSIGVRRACSVAPSRVQILRAGSVAGLGIALSQYMGTSSMQMAPALGFKPVLISASALICVIIVTAAVALVSKLRTPDFGLYQGKRIGASLGIGLVAPAGPCFGIEAMRLTPGSVSLAVDSLLSTKHFDPMLVAGGLALICLLVIGITHFIAYTGARAEHRIAALLSRLEVANRNLSWLARHDPLTGLPNRTLLKERMEEAFDAARRSRSQVAVLLIDLDGFKPVNDNLGHHVGDAVLCEVARRLRGQVRSVDTIARFGGDEFILMMQKLDQRSVALNAAQRVVEAISEPIFHSGHEIAISASVGIAMFPEDGDENRILVAADTAMYESKQSGRATWRCYSSQMERGQQDLVALQRDLRHALDNDEFELYYQPKLDLRTGTITAAEALIRWHHPVDGLRLPGTFIPVAERLGLINPIGDWLIETACRQAVAWQRQGLHICVAVNVSPQQFRQRELVEKITRAAFRHGVRPSGLSIEITESTAMSDPAFAREAINRLSQLGIHAAIDDFGTGHSCLATLRDLPVRQLKIDKSFVADLGVRPRAKDIMRAVIELARALDLEVVAEGVETQPQARMLEELGCDVLQGYLISRPAPANKVIALLNRSISIESLGEAVNSA